MPKTLADVRQALRRAPREVDDARLRRAAVVAILTPGPRVWFMRRAEARHDPWSGHLSFPGGREEPADAGDLWAAACRETAEEVGVDLEAGHRLGTLDDRTTRPHQRLMVRPFVVALDAVPRWELNHEVQSMHALSLEALLEGRGRGRMRWPSRAVGVSLPRVDFDGVRLWGLTLQMVDDLLDRLDGRGQGLARPVSPEAVLEAGRSSASR